MICMATSSAEARRLARELPDVTDHWDGHGIGDSADSDGEPIDEEVGDSRACPPVAFGPTDPTTELRRPRRRDRRGPRTVEAIVPGLHDSRSAFYPVAVGSPFLNSLGLERRAWITLWHNTVSRRSGV